MQLIDRYVNAVKLWLPKDQKEDIALELAEELHSQVEEKEEEFGRALTEEEIEEILKKSGNPVLVAQRYSPQRYLISPRIFPFYLAAIKGLALFYLLPWLAVWLGMVVFMPSYRQAHPGWGVFGTLGGWIETAIYAVGFITVCFVGFEWLDRKENFFERWNPRKLPVIKEPNQASRFNSVAEIVFGLAWLVWWSSAWTSSWTFVDKGEAIQWSLGPIWHQAHVVFFAPFVILQVASIFLSGLSLMQPSQTRPRLLARSFVYGGLAIVSFLSLARSWAETNKMVDLLRHGTPATPKGEALTAVANVGVGLILAGFTVGIIIAAIVHLYKATRSGSGSAGAYSLNGESI